MRDTNADIKIVDIWEKKDTLDARVVSLDSLDAAL